MANTLQAEGLCLRFPENLPPHANLTHEGAVQMLLRAVGLATQVPFHPSYIDKPPDGQIYLLFIPGGLNFPLDGIRWMEHEQRYAIPVTGGRVLTEVEVFEARHGFIPLAGEMGASRVRRRYRLLKGGHPYLVLVHYSRGQSIQIPPGLQGQPVRQYPLRQHNEPAVFVLGEKQGQRVPPSVPVGGMPPNVGVGVGAGGMGVGVGVGGRPDAQAMLAQQNREMEALERRSQRERSASMNPGQRQVQPPPQRLDEEDSAEELEHISTRTLALTRYRRNHEFMNEVFTHAAFGEKHQPKPPTPYSIFDKAELENRVGLLNKEIEELQAKSVARRAARDRDQGADMSVDEVGAVPSVVVT